MDNLSILQPYQINHIVSYLDYGEQGIVNLICHSIHNNDWELNINGFILNDKLKEWYCEYSKFDIKIVDCSWICFKGYLNCLKYARKNNCSCDETICRYAALNGHLDCLKYAHLNGCPWDELTCSNATWGGKLNCLKYAHINGCPWNEDTCYYAAWNGHLDCLKYAHENSCPWDEFTCKYAAMNGHLDCLKYAHTNGCPWDDKQYLLEKCHDNCKLYIEKYM